MNRSGLKVLIVDDEEPARELLRALLGEWRGVTVVGEAGDGATALALANSEHPDVVFLDVQMPGMSGVEVAAELMQLSLPPAIVFVTAFDQYAVRAFELSATDYLLKPFDSDRLRATMERLNGASAASSQGVVAALEQLLHRGNSRSQDTIVLKKDGRHVFINVEEIEWIEAVGKECRVHTHAVALQVRESLNNLHARLDGTRFVRVHRSAVVNRTKIREMQPWFKGDYVLILRDGARVVSGRTYRAAVVRLLAGSAELHG